MRAWKASLLGCAFAVDLVYPIEKQASAGLIPMTLGTAPFANYGFDAYGFDGSIPGPTLRVNPGEDLMVELTNNLSSATPCSSTSGDFCDSMITNLHTHGLHVSSKGVADGLAYESDNVLAEVSPGQTTTFQFSIPANHMGGTHWYHPHHHHATALQAGGGAAGFLIVEDPPGYLPQEYEEMPEKVLFVSGHNLNTLQEMAVAASAQVLTTAATDATASGFATNVFLVNGQINPTMPMTSNTWHRLRMVYAAVEQTLELSIMGNATCEWKLLAKDGIYLDVIPRPIVNVHLHPGARSDVAISCSCATYPCEATLRGVSGEGDDGGQDDDAGPAAAGAAAARVSVMTFSISEGSAAAASALPIISVQRPCYLVDLRRATVAGTGSIGLDDEIMAVQWNGNGQSMTYANVHQNGGTMSSWPPLVTLQAGNVYEVTVGEVGEHPFHIHVNPFQVTNMGAEALSNGYFWVGDWHDTLLIPGAESATIRYHTDVFTGKLVLHCHILEHEDEGMMGIMQIDGTEGATFAQVETLDSTCYRGSFDASGCPNSECWTAGTLPTTTTESGSAANSPRVSCVSRVAFVMVALTWSWVGLKDASRLG